MSLSPELEGGRGHVLLQASAGAHPAQTADALRLPRRPLAAQTPRATPLTRVQGATWTGQDTWEQHVRERVLAHALHFLSFSRVRVQVCVL